MSRVLKIAGKQVAAGQRRSINIPVARLYTHTEMTMPVHVLRGKKDGPRLFVCAAIHGDEIIGVEIIRRLLKLKILQRLRGTLIAVPVVNVYGFINHTRYLPDRRDLNRFFPGSEKGSLTSRLANIFMDEIVANSTHGIDLHAGSHHRINLPHIRACLDNPETEMLWVRPGPVKVSAPTPVAVSAGGGLNSSLETASMSRVPVRGSNSALVIVTTSVTSLASAVGVLPG